MWFDAHLDLACLAVLGRDMLAPVDRAGGPHPPAAATLASLAEGHVGACLGTIFVESGGDEPEISYAPGDAEAAHARGLDQLRVYEQWAGLGLIQPLGRGEAAEGEPLRLGILIEGADPIRSPAELAWWKARGVVAVGLAWWRASRYAGGNGTPADSPEAGLSAAGRELVDEIDRLGLVHDVSHLADRAFDELVERARGRVIASHSNSRAIMGDPANQRHLTDAQVRAVVSHRGGGGGGGVIGLNLFSKFLSPGVAAGTHARATIDEAVAHVERITQIAGSRACVGLGSDLDGGFSAAALPEGIDLPEHYERLANALANRGWRDAEIEGFRWGNWARVLMR
jgi:membrane dipeptidase